MIPFDASLRKTRRFPFATYCLLAIAMLLLTVRAALANNAADSEKPNFFLQVAQNLFNSRGMMETLGQPEYTIAAFIVLNLIVFVETGLLIGFCLPGDSLLVTAGLVAAGPCEWNLPLLLATLSLSAVVGDSVGFSIGFKTGPKIFNREKSLLFNKDHLLKAQAFYERHGGKTIVLARFMPFLRTFAPVVAGVGRMNYGHFVFYNIFGGVGWVCSMVLCGYYLPALLNPLMRPVFGEAFAVEEHVEKVVIVVVLVSIAPAIALWLKSKLGGRKGEIADANPFSVRSENATCSSECQ
jgi:membrane-associated protein